jgi:polar amino acid transport system substrate-binding protein
MPPELSRRSLLRGLGVAAVGVPLSGWLAGCSTTEPGGAAAAADDNVLERGRDSGSLKVAIGNEPPYTKLEADGTVTGAEPDVLRAVLERLGIDDIKGVVTPYESMIPGLQAGRWDVIAAGLFMKQSRCAEVVYSEPVIVSTESFAVPTGNPQDILTVQDVLDNAGLKIAVLPGGFEEGILKTAGVPASQRMSVNDGRSGVEAVKAGRADAFFLPTLSLQALQEDDSGFDITPVVEDAPRTGSGAAFRKGQDAAVEEYNKELAAFKKTDEFAAIMEKWGFDPTAVEGVTSDELCQNKG